jgi:hypothetical protein
LTALLMIYGTDQALRDRFEAARQCVIEMFPHRRRPGETYQGFIKAEKRLRPAVVERLKDHLRGRHREVAGSYWERLGWIPFACDGSRVEVPRTTRNQALGCAGRKKTGPQLFVTTMYHMGTGLPWDWCIGKGTESERDHLRVMLAKLPPGSLVVADAGFTGYKLMRAMLAAGLSFLIRVGSNVTLLTDLDCEVDCEVDSDGQTVWLWPQDQRRTPPLKLRLIRLKRVTRRKREVCLLTNVFDRQRLSDETAAILYRLRWGVELFYRSYKQTLQQQKLRSGAPQQARWELHWGMTALLLLGLMSVERIVARGRDPLSLSVAQALRAVRQAMSRPCRGRYPRLGVLLAEAVKDEYQRRSSKKAHDWPHKKNEPPPGTPKIRRATQKESLRAIKTYAAA